MFPPPQKEAYQRNTPTSDSKIRSSRLDTAYALRTNYARTLPYFEMIIGTHADEARRVDEADAHHLRPTLFGLNRPCRLIPVGSIHSRRAFVGLRCDANPFWHLLVRNWFEKADRLHVADSRRAECQGSMISIVRSRPGHLAAGRTARLVGHDSSPARDEMNETLRCYT